MKCKLSLSVFHLRDCQIFNKKLILRAYRITRLINNCKLIKTERIVNNSILSLNYYIFVCINNYI